MLTTMSAVLVVRSHKHVLLLHTSMKRLTCQGDLYRHIVEAAWPSKLDQCMIQASGYAL